MHTQPTQQEELGELAFSILRPALTLLNPSKKEVVELNNCLLKLKSLWQRETRDEVLREIDSQFLAKSHMVVSGLHGDLFQIKKQDWNDIRKHKKEINHLSKSNPRSTPIPNY